MIIINDLFPLEQKGCRHGWYGCKGQLVINKMILENCKKRKRNLRCAWIDYKNVFNNVPQKWILRSSELLKVSLKHNMKNWKTQLTHTHESGTLMSDNINIKRGIFQGDSLLRLLFCISLWILQPMDIKSELSESPICFIWMVRSYTKKMAINLKDFWK